MISYEEFQKLDLRIGTVIEAEQIPETDKLLKLTVDFGNDSSATPESSDGGRGTRQIVSGIAEVISVEEIIDKQYIFILNLQPRIIKGVESQGMILAADDEGKPILISPIINVSAGSKVK